MESYSKDDGRVAPCPDVDPHPLPVAVGHEVHRRLHAREIPSSMTVHRDGPRHRRLRRAQSRPPTQQHHHDRDQTNDTVILHEFLPRTYLWSFCSVEDTNESIHLSIRVPY